MIVSNSEISNNQTKFCNSWDLSNVDNGKKLNY